MGVYSPYEVYPVWFDEIEPCPIENCPYAHGICWEAGYCLMEKILED